MEQTTDELTTRVEVKYIHIMHILKELYSDAYNAGKDVNNSHDHNDYSSAYAHIENEIENMIYANEILYIGKDNWPVEGIQNKPLITFIRRLIHTRKIMRYKTWLKNGGCKIHFN